MDERGKRFEDKIEYARERIEDLENWLSEERIEKKTIFASGKAFQELVECIMDMFAMMLSDLKLGVKDDYSNIEKLKEKNILGEDSACVVIEANGLRNRIVHRYNTIDEKRFIESAKELLPKLAKVIEQLEDFIQKQK